jgi:GNAT superfamily N-acetyltransferase/L-amino acid N-acyltransferase YncA
LQKDYRHRPEGSIYIAGQDRRAYAELPSFDFRPELDDVVDAHCSSSRIRQQHTYVTFSSVGASLSRALPDGRLLDVSVYRYPVNAATRAQLIDLLQQVFPRTDVDWLHSMRGVYADALTTCQVVGALEGTQVGSASVAFAANRPEVCVIEDVMTVPAERRRGIARTLTEQAVQLGFDAGCNVAYLGNTATVSSVYDRIGFTRIAGAFMRRPGPGGEDYERGAFAPGQRTAIRETSWGDLPAVACLMAQPSGPALAHYDQGLVSVRNAAPQRAVSNFTSVKYGVENAGGNMWSLVSTDSPHRVLGFASITPGPGPLRERTARCDATCHDHYAGHAMDLIEAMRAWAGDQGMILLEAFIAEIDSAKRAWFEAAGFVAAARLPGALVNHDQRLDVVVLQRSCERE